MTDPRLQALLRAPGLPALLAALPRARIVGGAVRDALAGLPTADIDLATPDPPDAVLAALDRAGLRAIPTGLAHGTVTALVHGRPFEITTLRRDVETDGRHATVAWTDDWREDAARRDFTINALSLAQDGTLHDYFGGAEDLAARRVRFVGDAATRIAEDALRILRFFRFTARYGAPPPDPAATAAIAAGTALLARLSAERVWAELKKLLTAPNPVPAITLMAELGVLEATLPEGADPDALARLQAAGAPPDPLLRLAALLTGDDAALATRLRLSNEEAATLAALRHAPAPPPGATDDDLRRLLADHPPAILIGRAWLTHPPDGADLRARLAALPVPIFPLEGRDAVALGATPGPAIGAALRATRAWWLAEGCRPDRAPLLAHLRAHLAAP